MYDKQVMIITTTKQLTEVCHRFADSAFITVDTEFIRERTFYPEVCLIQIATPDEAYCIDPLAEDIQLDALFELFQNKNVVKVFHAARQDIEIIFHLSGQIPQPVFDTQIGAMACGFGENVSYQQLVKSYLKIDLDKSMRCTNWENRPLNERQVQYALCDVTHLCRIYQKISDYLKAHNRFDWIQDELNQLTDPELYHPSPAQLTEKAKSNNLKGTALFIYQKLYIFRENLARQKNRPRRHILKDELLHELAIIQPTTPDQMKKMRNLTNGFEKSDIARQLCQTIAQALTENPPIVKEKTEYNFTNAQKNLIEILRLTLHLIATQEKVASSLIASNTDLENFVRDFDVPFNHGWRYQLFGKTALQIKKGETGLFYHPPSKKIQFLTPQSALTDFLPPFNDK